MYRLTNYHRYLNRTGWIFISPALVFAVIFMLYPIVSSLLLVTQKWQGLNREFVGLGNFVRIIHDRIFRQALGHNFFFMVVQIPMMVFLAMLIAVTLHQGLQRMKGIFRNRQFNPP